MKMKGMLRKDWYIFLKYGKITAVFIAAYAVIAVFSQNAPFYVVFSVVLGALMVKLVMAYEEQDKWDCMAVCLPLRPEQIVWEKYLESLVCSGAVAFLLEVGTFVARTFFSRENGLFSPLSTFLMLFFMGGLIASVELPILFRFGVSRGRIVLTLALMVLAGLLAGTVTGLWEVGNPQGSLSGAVSLPEGVLTAGTAAVTVILLAVSVRISVAVYKKREF